MSLQVPLHEPTYAPLLTEEGLSLAKSTVEAIIRSESLRAESGGSARPSASPATIKIVEMLNLMADGIDVEIAPASSELTVPQAAKFLKMSEGRLNELLDDDAIAYRLEDGQRMVQRESMLEFERETREMEEGCAELTRLSQEMGLYDD